MSSLNHKDVQTHKAPRSKEQRQIPAKHSKIQTLSQGTGKTYSSNETYSSTKFKLTLISDELAGAIRDSGSTVFAVDLQVCCTWASG